MVSVEALPDGRYNILLQGVREFAVLDETADHRLPPWRGQWRAADTAGVPRSCARASTRSCTAISRSASRRWWQRLLSDPTLSDELLINFLCYALRFLADGETGAARGARPRRSRARLCDVVQFALESRTARRARATSGTTGRSRPARRFGRAAASGLIGFQLS
jgi:hypothetical protein